MGLHELSSRLVEEVASPQSNKYLYTIYEIRIVNAFQISGSLVSEAVNGVIDVRRREMGSLVRLFDLSMLSPPGFLKL